MKNSKICIKNVKILISLVCVFSLWSLGFGLSGTSAQETLSSEVKEEVLPTSTPGNVSLDFKDADINNVLRILSYKSGVNIVASKDVAGLITVRLVDIPWEKALNIILRTYDFGYEKQDNVIIVTPLDKLTEQKKQEMALAEVQPTVTEVFTFKFLNAGDVKKTLEPQISPRGKITVLEMTGQAGWEFAAGCALDTGKRKRVGETRSGMSKTVVITDIPPVIEKIKKVIETIDIKPQQVLIETRIMEVNRDRLKDLGIDFATGTTGAETYAVTGVSADKSDGTVVATAGGHVVSGLVTPSVFVPESTITANATAGFNTGLEFIYKKLVGTQFEVILHALEEDVHTNTLSAPRIMTLNNQEASILVGTKYPILDSSTEEGVVTTTLDYYQDIGIQLNVVPQISGEDFINMIIHPAVTSYTSSSVIGANSYPVINTREAETQVLMKNSETIVIGGLLKDVESKGRVSVPILGDIPILGLLFQRRTTDIEKIDLLIFITAHIIRPGEITEEELKKLTSGREIKLIEPEEKTEVKKKKSNQGYIYKQE